MAVTLIVEIMKHSHDSTAEIANHWFLCSDQFLEAAGYLSSTGQQMTPPRIRLMCIALEYRLKAFICASRNGTPQTSDLTRLTILASHCGLAVTAEQFDGIAPFNRAHAGELDISGLPDLQWITHLCDSISAQAARFKRDHPSGITE